VSGKHLKGVRKRKMAKFVTCSNCGCHLDFGEVCDCKKQKEGVPPESVRPQEKYPALSLPRKRHFVKSTRRCSGGY